MAHREPNPFADEDHGALPGRGRPQAPERLVRGRRHLRPQSLEQNLPLASGPSAGTTRETRLERERGRQTRGPAPPPARRSPGDHQRSPRARDSLAPRARLGEREQTTAVRVDALRHLTAAEDHVQPSTMRANLSSRHSTRRWRASEAMPRGTRREREREERRRRAPAPAPTTPRGAFATRCVASRRRRREMDAEAEEREAELAAAWDKIRELQEALGAAREGEDREREEGEGVRRHPGRPD